MAPAGTGAQGMPEAATGSTPPPPHEGLERRPGRVAEEPGVPGYRSPLRKYRAATASPRASRPSPNGPWTGMAMGEICTA